MVKQSSSIIKHRILRTLVFSIAFIGLHGCARNPGTGEMPKHAVVIDGGASYQKMDGFGVNITPAQWQNGHLKKTLDLLTDDLGAVLFRFDCTGLANWLDPAKRNGQGKYSPEYLQEVYSSKIFRDAWETFRYLNAKGVQPHFNVSGRIPPELGYPDNPTRLKDFDGYAEMIVSMLWWARNKEHLNFSELSPFNETDLSYPEGPGIAAPDAHEALLAVVKKLDEYGLSDVRLIIMDDSGLDFEKMKTLIQDTSYRHRLAAFGFHTYGNGAEAEGPLDWYTNSSSFRKMAETLHAGTYAGVPLWMTEYGDLDQTGLIEYEFAWRSSRRIMKAIADGYAAGIAWDAFDNFHEHDTAWATYGLLRTDTTDWNYKPKKRYYAAKQLYKFVRPGFFQIAIRDGQNSSTFNIYKQWQDPLKHIRMLAFSGEQGKQFSFVAMSLLEEGFILKVQLTNLHVPDGSRLRVYRTSRNEDCSESDELIVLNGNFDLLLKERSIVTVTTLP